MQLDLLSYQLTPDELCENPAPKSCNPSAVRWQLAKAAVYLQLIRCFMAGAQTSGAVRRHEIERLHRLRQEALAEAEGF